MESNKNDSWTDQLKEKVMYKEPETTQQKELQSFIVEKINLIQTDPSELKIKPLTLCILLAHSIYEGSEIKGHKLKDLPFVIDDLKLMGGVSESLLDLDGCFVIAEPSESQLNYIV